MGQYCGSRAGIEAHREAAEPLCEDCRRSAARRAAIGRRNAAKRRWTAGDEGYAGLDDVDLSRTFTEHLNGGGYSAEV